VLTDRRTHRQTLLKTLPPTTIAARMVNVCRRVGTTDRVVLFPQTNWLLVLCTFMFQFISTLFCHFSLFRLGHFIPVGLILIANTEHCYFSSHIDEARCSVCQKPVFHAHSLGGSTISRFIDVEVDVLQCRRSCFDDCSKLLIVATS